ncbi:MAG TPA: 50S ribosomal protein L20 [Acidobacteriota bacterium]|nr:50S ribosomal protein L20 [Acidobacteriota bacterium]HNT18376.1 50S ribosomal protein L20 [Acidobacteriota bacterium]HPA27341.1 50S ribosomal protein L20 [Acidobacteriota bacterium]HQO20810.1 50S ribosomal protein L20 [Acidobacteriota bacterium]HQQ47642.1 50S ribosomal protein L20 [Acidobacteriota bacterium]
MARVKRGSNKVERRKKILKLAKGYFGGKSRLYRSAKEQVERSLVYSFIGRKQKKRDMRRLFITRINAACRPFGMSYSRFIDGLNKAQVAIDRKMLANLAVSDEAAFSALVEKARTALGK